MMPRRDGSETSGMACLGPGPGPGPSRDRPGPRPEAEGGPGQAGRRRWPGRRTRPGPTSSPSATARPSSARSTTPRRGGPCSSSSAGPGPRLTCPTGTAAGRRCEEEPSARPRCSDATGSSSGDATGWPPPPARRPRGTGSTPGSTASWPSRPGRASRRPLMVVRLTRPGDVKGIDRRGMAAARALRLGWQLGLKDVEIDAAGRPEGRPGRPRPDARRGTRRSRSTPCCRNVRRPTRNGWPAGRRPRWRTTRGSASSATATSCCPSRPRAGPRPRRSRRLLARTRSRTRSATRRATRCRQPAPRGRGPGPGRRDRHAAERVARPRQRVGRSASLRPPAQRGVGPASAAAGNVRSRRGRPGCGRRDRRRPAGQVGLRPDRVVRLRPGHARR